MLHCPYTGEDCDENSFCSSMVSPCYLVYKAHEKGGVFFGNEYTTTFIELSKFEIMITNSEIISEAFSGVESMYFRVVVVHEGSSYTSQINVSTILKNPIIAELEYYKIYRQLFKHKLMMNEVFENLEREGIQFSRENLLDRETSQENKLTVEALNQLREAIIQNYRKMPYLEYLKTFHWQEKRMIALDRSKHQCQVCSKKGQGVQLEVHHNNYNNLGNEKIEDLIVLCRSCHQMYHDAGKLKAPPKHSN